MNAIEVMKLAENLYECGYIQEITEADNDNFIPHTFYMTDGSVYTYDCTDLNSKENEKFMAMVTEIYPVIGIIRLIREAIRLGIVTDNTPLHKRISLEEYGEDYLAILNSDVFWFQIASETFEDITYKITFDRKKHNIRTKTEYASRTSQFVDTLIKRIMAKYNVLLVQKASWYTNELPTLPLDETCYMEDASLSDAEGETDTIQNQLKVLIHYRDNFNSTTCTENVIDDIYISMKGGEISYGFLSIGQSEAEPIYDVINESVSIDDVDSLLKIRSMIQEPSVKFKIFETLRENKDTNLSKLVEKRILEYDTELNSDPKIEFTITPLSMYCNHIVEKSCTYTLKSKNPFYCDYEATYQLTYNPADVSHTVFYADAEGDKEQLLPNEKLILAFTDRVKEGSEMQIRVTTKKYATNLYEISPRYHEDIYKDVWFSNEALVHLVDGKMTPYEGEADEYTYLRSEVVRDEITGRYMYITEAEPMQARDILGMEFLEDPSEIRYVSKDYVHSCDLCGHSYGSSEEVWHLYQESHRVVNMRGDVFCCDSCTKDNGYEETLGAGKSVIYSSGSQLYYLEDEKNPKHSGYCILCEDPKKGLLFIDQNFGVKPEQCKVCGKFYCKSHMAGEGLCKICHHDLETKKATLLPKNLQRNLKSCLGLGEFTKKSIPDSYYLKEENSLWIYTEGKKSSKVMYYSVDEETGFILEIGKLVEKR